MRPGFLQAAPGPPRSKTFSMRVSSESLLGQYSSQESTPARRDLVGQLEKRRRELWPLALVLVLEEYERVAPGLRAQLLHPRLQLRGGVVGAPQAEVAPVGGRDEGDLEVVLGFGDAQRDVVVAQQAEDLVVEPGR